jgi:hypothetical protein
VEGVTKVDLDGGGGKLEKRVRVREGGTETKEPAATKVLPRQSRQ